MENNKNKKSVKFQGGMLNFCDFIQVFVFTTNHHLKKINEKISNYIWSGLIFLLLAQLVKISHLESWTCLMEARLALET